MARFGSFTRRQFLATGCASLAVPVALGHSRASAMVPQKLTVVLSLPQAQGFGDALDVAGLRIDRLRAEAFVTDPARLAAYRGSRLVLVGTDADQTLFDMALAQNSTQISSRILHRATHREDPLTRLPVHGFETLANSCAYDLARDHAQTGSGCMIHSPEASAPITQEAPAADHWQARTLSRVLATATGRADAFPFTWQGAPRAFATLIADL